jgi:hypothetical protein
MDGWQFDRLARTFARTAHRRQVLGGLGGAALAAAGLRRFAQAQEATPAATPPADDVGFGQPFLFVQTFTGGTFVANPHADTPVAAGTPAAGVHGTYLLSLGGHPGQTVYFSDRPERIVGDAPTDRFVAGLGFGGGDPPNAALVTANAAGETVVAVLELLNPVVDIAAGTVGYEATLLDDYAATGLRHLIDRRETDDVPAAFGAASLFIDDCPKQSVICLPSGSNQCDVLGSGEIGGCWSWSKFACVFCNSPSAWCDENVTTCNGSCQGHYARACYQGV